jgi:hypothetical protein
MPDQSTPTDPTQPRDPVILPRRTPAPVRLAVLIMLAGAAVGVVSAIALIGSAGMVVRRFIDGAATFAIGGAAAESVGGAIRTVLIGVGVVTLVLAIAMAVLAFGVRAGRSTARIGALIGVGLGLSCGLGSSSYTVLGRNANWAIGLEGANDQLIAQLGQAYAEAMPGVLVGATGGLTDLQSLGYIAVAVLLLVPASHPHFRRRPPAAPSAPPATPGPATPTPSPAP